jgi:hypothetical protein
VAKYTCRGDLAKGTLNESGLCVAGHGSIKRGVPMAKRVRTWLPLAGMRRWWEGGDGSARSDIPILLSMAKTTVMGPGHRVIVSSSAAMRSAVPCVTSVMAAVGGEDGSRSSNPPSAAAPSPAATGIRGVHRP